MGKLTISVASFNSYIGLPEGNSPVGSVGERCAEKRMFSLKKPENDGNISYFHIVCTHLSRSCLFRVAKIGHVVEIR